MNKKLVATIAIGLSLAGNLASLSGSAQASSGGAPAARRYRICVRWIRLPHSNRSICVRWRVIDIPDLVEQVPFDIPRPYDEVRPQLDPNVVRPGQSVVVNQGLAESARGR